ncbi:FAD-linked oxidase [Lentzea sp. NBRC 105346]|uniref:FAD-binding oxidoreductase n=1 Tax=Lentzea sp. NBRC 105346 TaxID=3032205 RepID=UPI0024A11731|nr:FAD-binding oxidoreductase [Lentzea sp. NBRC 105346]GLZ35942.1 FAD-linked oxidase [Lentzea sp. NBRC 105346]
MTIDLDVTTLRTGFHGIVCTPGDPEYDEARSIWNGAIDRRPALIARCGSAGDVAAAVRYARETGLEIAVRGGGHSFSGASVCDDGLMIDLSRLNEVTVDPVNRTAVCGGGAALADLDAATQEHGLAVPAGTISHTGVAGLTLGGGFGWLTARHGLSCDNLIGADVVLADGRLVRASATENPDLFWAIRGGGGNFGIVTAFEFRLFPIGPMVNLGMFFFTLEQGADALRLAREIVPALPRSCGALVAALNAPPAPFVPEQHHFAPGFAILIAGFESPEEHASLVAPIREALPPLFEFVTPLPYAALQSMLDDSAPWGILGYEKAVYVDDLTEDVVNVIAGLVPSKASPMSLMPMFYLGGAFCDTGADDTAFGGDRNAKWVINMAAVAPTPELLEADRAWSRALFDALLPHTSESGVYINFMAEYDADRVRATYGPEKYARLAALKAQYDPENLLHRNMNIKPA